MLDGPAHTYSLKLIQANDGYKFLFDGKTTNGWRGAKLDDFPKHGWVVKDGVLTVLESGGGESEAGGWFGPELKFAGFDAIIIKGRAENPVYLWIHDGKAEFKDAAHLWGKPLGEVHDAIREELGDSKIRIAQTGPSGEKMVRYACVINELKHANGRSGMF